VVTCPWEPTHRLVRIGVKGRQGVVVRADSKIAVEFNPRLVASYRLIGYDRQETKNSTEQNPGSRSVPPGYTLTTLYEVVPARRVRTTADMPMRDAAKDRSEAFLTAKLELNEGGANSAVGYMQRTVRDPGSDFAAAPGDLKFAAAVAEFGMILRDSEYKGKGSLQQVIEWAEQGTGADVNGNRADFIELVRRTQTLKRS
jgi:Ca-activated chloride channel homolog